MYRDFTYIDDIIGGVEKVLGHVPEADRQGVRYKIYNIGNHKPEKLMDFIASLEKYLGKEARKEYLPMQPGDVYQTYADISDLKNDFGFQPETSMDEGMRRFVEWFKEYYGYEETVS